MTREKFLWLASTRIDQHDFERHILRLQGANGIYQSWISVRGHYHYTEFRSDERVIFGVHALHSDRLTQVLRDPGRIRHRLGVPSRV